MACAQHGAITTIPPEIDTSKEEHDTINKHFNLEEVIEGRDVVCALNVMSHQLYPIDLNTIKVVLILKTLYL